LEVLLGSATGFAMARTIVEPTLPHLADLALVAAGSALEVYGAEVGREAAVLLGTFGSLVAPPNFLPPAPGFPSGLELGNDAPPEPGNGSGAMMMPRPLGKDAALFLRNLEDPAAYGFPEMVPDDQEEREQNPDEMDPTTQDFFWQALDQQAGGRGQFDLLSL